MSGILVQLKAETAFASSGIRTLFLVHFYCSGFEEEIKARVKVFKEQDCK
jgi:hypothetical protein